MIKNTNIVILAAGQSKRMKSSTSKILHKIGGISMIDYIIYNLQNANFNTEDITMITSENIISQMDEHKFYSNVSRVKKVIQHNPMGTGHAVLTATKGINKGNENTIILFGDTPFISMDTIKKIENLLCTGSNGCVLCFDCADVKRSKYGRVFLDNLGKMKNIIEYKDCNESEKSNSLSNSGVMGFKTKDLIENIKNIESNNNANEYYLTDIIEIMNSKKLKIDLVKCNELECIGVNSAADLAHAEEFFQQKQREKFLDMGVFMTDPSSVYFSFDTKIQNDVFIENNVFFGTKVSIESGCKVCAFSYLEGVDISSGCTVGPFARIRGETSIGENSKVGNFVELKKSKIANNVKISHLSYIGDSEIEENVNIGAGTITCNYDGKQKHKTKINKNTFIGSNSALIAPIEIGQNVLVGAGSVITKNVPNDTMAIAREKQKNIPRIKTK